VADEATVVGWFERVVDQLGRIDCLVNNAGIVDQQARLDEFSLKRVRRIFEVNVFGALICMREAVRRLSTRHGGHGGSIVNVSSAASTLGSPNEYIDYAASKGALDTLTIGLAKEVAGEGIRVNAVRPGLIETEMHADSGEPGRVQRLAATLPMLRGGTPQEVAQTIVWLSSEAASYVTGSLVNCAGGR
jgi:NAD(P)-dependent dehydrogenase (short-subunit alcohol dehydrogenase family)